MRVAARSPFSTDSDAATADSFDPNDISMMGAPPPSADHSSDDDSDDYPTRPHPPPIKYVYDAALERSEQSRNQTKIV